MKKKLQKKKGFTLMEMLIVVAIIAILVAIAIPTFAGALDEARMSADKANIRAWYAETIVDSMIETAVAFNVDTLQTDLDTLELEMGAGASATVNGTDWDSFTVTYDPGNGDEEVTIPNDL